jgi:hypothetical protein
MPTACNPQFSAVRLVVVITMCNYRSFDLLPDLALKMTSRTRHRIASDGIVAASSAKKIPSKVEKSHPRKRLEIPSPACVTRYIILELRVTAWVRKCFLNSTL